MLSSQVRPKLSSSLIEWPQRLQRLTFFFILQKAGYDAYKYYNSNPELKQCIDQIQTGFFTPSTPDLFKDLADVLLKYDRFYSLADYDDYIKCQDKVSKVYLVSFFIFVPPLS